MYNFAIGRIFREFKAFDMPYPEQQACFEKICFKEIFHAGNLRI